MRKASKAAIAQALADYAPWRARVNARLEALPPEAQTKIGAWADDVRRDIERGDLGMCNQALVRSVVRAIEDFESGFYVGVTSTGGFQCTA